MIQDHEPLWQRSLRDYQSQAVEAIHRSLESHRATLLVLATGLGKTIVATQVILDRRHLGPALWLAHRRELIDQARDTIPIRCDVEMAERMADVGGLVDDAPVVIASVPSMHRGRRARFDRSHFATIVVDEAHHSTAKTYREIIAHFPGAKVVGLTATPDRGDEVALGHIYEDVAYEYGIREGIRDGHLAPIRPRLIEVADLDLSDVRVSCGDLSEADIERALLVDGVLHQMASPMVQEAGPRRTLVFAPGVAAAKALVDVLDGYGVKAVSVDGSTPRELRGDRISNFRAGRVQYLVNCAVFTEGFDAPETSCIAIARPTKSRALYAQMLGRGTRKADGKEDCLVLDFSGSAGRHSLITPFDVLAGKPIPEPVSRRARELSEQGRPSEEALAEAEAEAIERERRQEAQRLRSAKLRADAAYRATEVDPFAIDSKAPQLSVERERLINSERNKRGLCSYRQARLLARYGIDVDVPGHVASVIIGRLRERYHFRPPAHIKQRMQEWAADRRVGTGEAA